MLKGSLGSHGLRRPKARKASSESPVARTRGSAVLVTSPGSKRSKAASTGVWVVKTLPARVARNATRKGTLFFSAKLNARASTANAA